MDSGVIALPRTNSHPDPGGGRGFYKLPAPFSCGLLERPIPRRAPTQGGDSPSIQFQGRDPLSAVSVKTHTGTLFPPLARPSGQSPDTRPPASRESGQPQKTLSAAVIFGHQNREQTGSPWLHAAAREKEWFFQRVSSRLFTISQFTTLQNASMNCPRLFR